MQVEIDYSSTAEERLIRIVDDLWERSPQVAQNFADAHDAAIEQLLRFPESGSPASGAIRSIRIPRSPYRIVYTFDGSKLTVTNIFDARSGRAI